MKNTPIIFCHYGNSNYLKYVFECVRISNPKKEIILLGDKSNKKVAQSCGVSHFNLSDFDSSPDIEIFDKFYQLIETKGFDSVKHGEDWNKFVFRKWFILNNFLIQNKIEKFWHFDSDNMIFSDLLPFESLYSELDCTEQCEGNCMKGLFNNQEIIARYVKKINEVFMCKKTMEQKSKEMANLEGNACFNEMSVYGIFKKDEKFSAIRLNEIRDGASFDDLICRSHGLKMEKLPHGEDVKVVFFNPDGRFFCQEEESKKPVMMHALNLSWVPLYTFSETLKHFKKNHKKPNSAFDANSKTLSQVSIPLKQRFKKYRKYIKLKLKKMTKKK